MVRLWPAALAPLLVTSLPVCAAARQASDATGPVFNGFVVKMAAAPESSAAGQRAVERAAAGTKAEGWRVQEVPGQAGTFRLLPPPAESATTSMTPAQAWARAYALRVNPAFEYVEPAFATPGAPFETSIEKDCTPAARALPESGGDTPPLPGAMGDSEWSLGAHGANVIEAWKLFGDDVPGHDVWVGHPDTGYRRHPEIWSANAAESRSRPDLGWDFVDNDTDPEDAFAAGILRWPGHGTRTSSVIVSPRGRQVDTTANPGISGVAPGARVIPLRVANGVVLFDQTNLASAIRAASGDDRNLVKQQVQVISISLGGPPSRALADAVAFAERRGVLVIAAAGNNVRKVVWPARYPNVIAIAASNVDGATWSGSSGGSMVAVAAPGESVWVASPERTDAGDPVNCISMSSGTSYGTATTAGIAALWVSKHRDEPAFKALVSSGQATKAFRAILRQTVRKGTNWDGSRYGPGIVDAFAAIAAPLPAVTESAVPQTPPTRCDANLAALESLFDEAVQPAPRGRIAKLFDTNSRGLCSVAPLADEVAFLYATNTEVAARIDGISSASPPTPAQYRAARAAIRASGSEPLRRAIPAR